MTHKEYPILYSTPMIQAILDGRKSQTRRIIKGDFYVENDPPLTAYIPDYITGEPQPVKLPCPYGKVGDFTWARETFVWDSISSQYLYRADNHCDLPYQNKWQPPIFMPRSACRIITENIDIRVERVADISEKDAIAEGIEKVNILGDDTFNNRWKDYESNNIKCGFHSPIQSYRSLWNSINNEPKLNKKTDTYIVYPFDEQSAINVNKAGYWGNTYRNKPLIVVPNPWVWVIKFKK
jgi:hypothetical protein